MDPTELTLTTLTFHVRLMITNPIKMAIHERRKISAARRVKLTLTYTSDDRAIWSFRPTY